MPPLSSIKRYQPKIKIKHVLSLLINRVSVITTITIATRHRVTVITIVTIELWKRKTIINYHYHKSTEMLTLIHNKLFTLENVVITLIFNEKKSNNLLYITLWIYSENKGFCAFSALWSQPKLLKIIVQKSEVSSIVMIPTYDCIFPIIPRII